MVRYQPSETASHPVAVLAALQAVAAMAITSRRRDGDAWRGALPSTLRGAPLQPHGRFAFELMARKYERGKIDLETTKMSHYFFRQIGLAAFVCTFAMQPAHGDAMPAAEHG